MTQLPAVRSALVCVALVAPVFSAAPVDLNDGLRTGTLAEARLRTGPFEALTTDVVSAQFPDTTSVLVYKDGRLVYERYFGAGGLDVLNDSRSATQTVTALLVGEAIADGALKSTEEPAFARLASLAPFRNDDALKHAITLMDLLTMSSALDCNDFDDASVGNAKNMYPLTNWSRWVVDLPVNKDYARNPSGRGPFSDCTAGAFLLGQIVQRATNRPLDQYADARLFRPLGIRERRWKTSPAGELQGGGGLQLRSRDLLKLGVLLGDQGQWQGVQLVPAAWVRRMQTVSNVVNEQQSYGMLLRQRQYKSACGTVNGWSMSGDGGNAIVSVPLESMVVAVTRTRYNQRGMHDETARLLENHVFAALSCTN